MAQRTRNAPASVNLSGKPSDPAVFDRVWRTYMSGASKRKPLSGKLTGRV